MIFWSCFQAYADLSMKGAGKTPKLYLNGEKHPFDTGSAVCSGIYEEVGSPMMQKVALLTRKMAFLGSMRWSISLRLRLSCLTILPNV